MSTIILFLLGSTRHICDLIPLVSHAASVWFAMYFLVSHLDLFDASTVTFCFSVNITLHAPQSQSLHRFRGCPMKKLITHPNMQMYKSCSFEKSLWRRFLEVRSVLFHAGRKRTDVRKKPKKHSITTGLKA